MPSTIIHTEVGYYLSRKINISSYDYYLGVIAPDSPNLEGFAEKNIRWKSHQRDSNYTTWKNNIKVFYNENKNNYSKDFLIGYYIHILTDIIYDESLYLKVRNEITKENTLNEAHEIMRKDMDNYSFNEINIIENILKSSSKSYDILNINKDQLSKFKEKVINNFSKKNKSVYINDTIINELNKKVYEELVNELDF